MNIFTSYKRTKLFLWINITGLAIGLASSIMLILFVTSELSYDKHFKNSERIIKLNTVIEKEGNKEYLSISLREAYDQLPMQIPEIEAATQIHKYGTLTVASGSERFQNVELHYADPGFFKVFQMKFIEGTPESAFADINSVVLTLRQAEIMFGSSGNAMGKIINAEGQDMTVSAVVKELPFNTHFSFDILANINSISYLSFMRALDFHTYYLVAADAPMNGTRLSINNLYIELLKPFMERTGYTKVYGMTEKLADIYLSPKSDRSFKSGDARYIWMLSGLALFILILAITNFINLFIAQGESRMQEIGIRKTNGATKGDIVRRFYSEVFFIVLIAFTAGFILAVIITPYFSQLIARDIELIQLLNPLFIICAVALFIITSLLSAFYPVFYLSRFSPLDILGKRLKFSKRTLSVAIVAFQSAVTIILISVVFIILKQSLYLHGLPIGYNPKDVVSIDMTRNIQQSYAAVKQELQELPGIKAVSGSEHTVGIRASGQSISFPENREKGYNVSEYRVVAGLCELMEFQLTEGDFFKESTPDSVRQMILNESAVKMLNLQNPVVGTILYYRTPIEVIGVIKNFYYGELSNLIEPLIFAPIFGPNPSYIYLRFDNKFNRLTTMEMVSGVLKKFDPDFVANPQWSEDIYREKFSKINSQTKVVSIASALSVLIAMLGLIAIHLYSMVRRTKEIAIRRVNGATQQNIFTLFTRNIVCWILIAGVVAIPVAYYLVSNWLNDYTNRTTIGIGIFLLPIIIQCIIAILVTSGVTFNILRQNPAKSLKTE
jgi:ABC-type antimicrobial peptide transport system, permease component